MIDEMVNSIPELAVWFNMVLVLSAFALIVLHRRKK